MRKLVASFVACAMLAGGAVSAPALAQQKRSDQESARKETREGNVLGLRDLERIVIPQIERMDGNFQYLTPEWDSVARAYRFKFIDSSKGQVIWVDVDARTGKILRIAK